MHDTGKGRAPVRLASAIGLSLLAACGGDGGSGPDGGDADFSATIEGAEWTAASQSATAAAGPGGTFTIAGGSAESSPRAIIMTLYNIGGPGTYPFGVGPTVAGGIGSVTTGSSSYTTPLSGAAGTVTISSLTSNRIAGTFEFTAGADPVFRHVTDGRFDLPFTASGSIAVPDYAGNLFSGTLNDAPWNAATVVMVAAPASGTLAVGISNLTYQITLILSGWTGTGSYDLGTGVSREMSAMAGSGSTGTWGGSGLSTGTVTVTSASATRVSGSYDVTLMPAGAGATGNLHFVGTFSFGIQP